MKKTKIEWCDSTWNPVVGCLHTCEYCYARRIAERFKTPGVTVGETVVGMVLDEPFKDEFGRRQAYPFGFTPTLHSYRLEEPQRLEKPRTIFVCSMADLFGEWVPNRWVEEVFEACEKAPQHRYLFLTKNPQRYIDLASAGKLPAKDNMWYGTTIETPCQEAFWSDNHHTFVSVEPILMPFDEPTFEGGITQRTEWAILGAETGNRKGKVTPRWWWIESMVKELKKNGKRVFMKDSLIPIVGEENMLRELPWEAETVEKIENENTVALNKLNCAGVSAVE